MPDFTLDAIRAAIRPPPPSSVVEWAQENVRLVGSAISEEYRPDVTPWTREPLECAGNGTHRCTFVKPVQSGGSTVGEMALCYWACVWNGGDIQYNWPNDVKAKDRWKKRVEKILRACQPLLERFSEMEGRFNWLNGLVIFPSFNLIMQGVKTDTAVSSDSIRGQVNEEIHDVQGGWAPGRLDQCYHRLIQFYNHVIFNISNGSRHGDQLHQAFENGTRQFWEVECPHCRKHHRMRTRWDDKMKQLGGLRYDVERPNAESVVVKNIRYQFPCGGAIADDLAVRRRLSLSGRYCDPTNIAAPLTERSYTLEAVAVDSISWLELIREKQKAIHAMKRGDKMLYETYVKERECGFVDTDDRPISARIVLTEPGPVDEKKLRVGLSDRVARFGALDRQGGHPDEGINPYWWGVIQDVDKRGNTAIVWEGKPTTDGEASGIMAAHGVQPHCVVCDSRFDTTHVYGFCIAHGFNAIMGSPNAYWAHPDGSRHIFSPERPLHAEINAPSKFPYVFDPATSVYRADPREPLFWLYSKAAIRERLDWWRNSGTVKYIIPNDVSEQFIAHQSAESLEERRNTRTGEITKIYVQHKRRNDLYVCCCYIAMLAEMSGLIGQAAVEKFTVEIKEETEGESNA